MAAVGVNGAPRSPNSMAGMKRSLEQMEAGSAGKLQNPEHQVAENPKKKQMLNPPNGASAAPSAGVAPQRPGITNGTHSNGAHRDIITKDRNGVPGALRPLEEAPPEIPAAGREQMIPFRNVVARVAQKAFTDLVGVLDQLAGETPQARPPTQDEIEQFEEAKRVLPAGTKFDSDLVRRKWLWDYAGDHRAKLIKLLILSQWARRKPEIDRMIDVSAFLQETKRHCNDAIDRVGFLNHHLEELRLPAPDLQLSLKVLQSGKADWISDLGYLPQKPMTTKQMLEAMRDANATLIERLHLHDTLPEAFHNFAVRDGRVTFKVEDEFELALSIGSDKPEEQLYFVDFRFCFSPGGGRLPEGYISQQMAVRIDHVLGKDGLGACYDFLHDFTLTHKLGVLKAQARDLTRSRWGDNIKVEHVHRSLILQYWTHRPGAKSWIEIGIRKHRTQEELLRTGLADSPYLAVRWYRHGKLVSDPDIEIDAAELSLETVLKDVVAAHTNHILASTRTSLCGEKMAGKRSPFQAVHRASPVEPADCALDILFPDGHEVTLNQEPISGRFALLPFSARHSRCEAEMAKLQEPAVGLARLLKEARALVARDRHRITTSLEGWQVISMPKLSTEVLGKYLGKDVFTQEFYRPTKDWPDKSCLCLSHHLSGRDFWHLVILRPKDKWSGEKTTTSFLLPESVNPFEYVTKIFDVASKGGPLGAAAPGDQSSSPHRTLRWVVSQAAGFASRYADRDWLVQEYKARPNEAYLEPISENVTNLAQQAAKQGPSTSFDPVSAPALRLDLRVMKDAATNECYHRSARSVIDGVFRQQGLILTNTTARLNSPLPIAERSLHFDQGSIRLAHNDKKTLIFTNMTPLGAPSVKTVFERISGFSRIAKCVADLRKMGLQVEAFDLKRITASFGSLIRDRIKTRKVTWSDQQYRVFFDCDEKGPVGVRFDSSGPFKTLESDFNDMLSAANGRFDGLARRLTSLAPALFTIVEQSRQPITGPYYVFGNRNELRMLWGVRKKFAIGCKMEVAFADGEPCWRVSLFRDYRGGPLEQLQKIEGEWATLCQSKGNGITGMVTEMKVEFADASSALWHIFDAFDPHLRALYEKMKNNEPSTSGNGRPAMANSSANGAPKMNPNTGGKSQNGDKIKRDPSPNVQRKPSKSKENHPVIELD